MKRLPALKPNKIREDASPLVDFVSDKLLVKERYELLPKGERQRYLCYASAVWGLSEAARLVGVTNSNVYKAMEKYSHLRQELALVANQSAAKVFLNKALAIASTINIDKIPDERKPQCVKALMDSVDIAKLQGVVKKEDDDADEVMEIYYRVKRKVSRQDGDEPIDITGEIEDVVDAELNTGETEQ